MYWPSKYVTQLIDVEATIADSVISRLQVDSPSVDDSFSATKADPEARDKKKKKKKKKNLRFGSEKSGKIKSNGLKKER